MPRNLSTKSPESAMPTRTTPPSVLAMAATASTTLVPDRCCFNSSVSDSVSRLVARAFATKSDTISNEISSAAMSYRVFTLLILSGCGEADDWCSNKGGAKTPHPGHHDEGGSADKRSVSKSVQLRGTTVPDLGGAPDTAD